MRFQFNETKAAQAAAYLLRLGGGRMPYMKLVKLLYLADKQCLLDGTSPITGDVAYSMKHGLVLSEILDLARGVIASKGRPWGDYVAKSGFDSVLRPNAPADLDDLSEHEKQALSGQFEAHKNHDGLELGEWMHDNCPEYKDTASSLPVTPEEILRAENRTEEEIRLADQLSQEMRLLREALCAE